MASCSKVSFHKVASKTKQFLQTKNGERDSQNLKIAIRENIPYLNWQYKKIFQAHVANKRKYWLEEAIENECIGTQVGVYDEISPRISGNPLYTPPLVTIQLQNKGCFSVTLPLFTDLIL